jgi:hypothetical protein
MYTDGCDIHIRRTQVTEDDISSVVLSVKVPMAINCWVFPREVLWFVGVTAIDTKTAGVTVSEAEGDIHLKIPL